MLHTENVLTNGDFDSNGVLDGGDFAQWQTNFNSTTNVSLATGDSDADGDVDGADFVAWQTGHVAGNSHTDPTLSAQHAALLALVPYSAVTNRVIKSGSWNDPSIWEHGVPAADANVLIPASVDVVIDSIQLEKLRTIRVDGELEFATDVDTQLTVDTLVIAASGTLEIGTHEEPIEAGITARILIADRGAIDTNWDPTQLSRGLISHGHVSMYGAEVTAYEPIPVSLPAGTTTIVLPEAPTGWKAGDRLVLTGTQYGEDDELTIQAIDGNTVTVEPLKHDHVLPEAGLSLYLANVTRNVVIESENAHDISHRGHTMFMHTPNVSINNVGFYGLGRTDKRYALESGQYDSSGKLVDGTGLNPVGRYAVHFHYTGLAAGSEAAQIHGSVVVDSPGWGIVNHHSNVIAEDNVVFDALGAAFVTEAGDELGAFRRNLAIRSEGSGDLTEARTLNAEQDLGHEGIGFWVQGSGVDVVDNIATGQRTAGFMIWGQGLVENGRRVQFPAYNLPNPSWAAGWEKVAAGSFPIQFRNNLAFASNTGLATRYTREGSFTSEHTQIDNFTAWNVKNGIATHYTFLQDYNNLKLLGNGKLEGTGLDGGGVTNTFTINGGRIEGFRLGISFPHKGTSAINGTELTNLINIESSTNLNEIADNHFNHVQFGQVGPIPGSSTAQYDIRLDPLPVYSPRELTKVFQNVSSAYFNDQELFRIEQAAAYVLFPPGTPANQAPAAFIGKTNQQLFDEFGLALGGAVAPADAVLLPGTNALASTEAVQRSTIEQVSATLVNSLDYTLSYRLAPGAAVIVESSSTQLEAGWNVITRLIEGAKHSFLVYADITPPSFTVNYGNALAINPADLARGITIGLSIIDDFYNGGFRAAFRLDTLPLQTKADGTNFVTLEFEIMDFAGNKSLASVEIRVDSTVPRITDPDPVVLDPYRQLSFTVLGLLISQQPS